MIPLQVTLRGVDRSEAIETQIRRRADKLLRFHRDIAHCRVVVDAPHKHHHKGNVYQVRIDVAVAGREIVSAPNAAAHTHADLYVALRDAFAATERRLKEDNRRHQA